jgi:hypothetical protein
VIFSPVRYADEIQCAAAKIVHSLRMIAQNQNVTASTNYSTMHVRDGEFYSLHVRRGDFVPGHPILYMEADEIYHAIKDEIPDGSVVYISTDEKEKDFFRPLMSHYDVKFMDDFLSDLHASALLVNPDFYGMIDQLVVSFLVFFSSVVSNCSQNPCFHCC